MGARHDDELPMSAGEAVPAALVEALLRLCQGDFSHRLPRTFARDEGDTVAFFFNAIAEELERVITTSREHETRLETTVTRLSEALTRVAAGDFADVNVERDFRGDALDVLVFLVNNTIHELASLVTEKERRAELDRQRLERLVDEGARRLDESEENFQRIFDAAPQPLVLFDIEALVVRRGNARAEELFGAERGALVGRSVHHFFESHEDRVAMIEALTRTGSVENLALRLLRVDGSPVWALVNASIVRTAEGSACMAGIADLTEQKRVEAQLREAVTTDALTGALSRRRLLELAEDEVVRAKRYGRPLCVALLDLDHFKSINDRFGHLVGDDALRAVGATLRATLRRGDWVGRYGGEEFGVVLPETRIAPAREAVERVRMAVEALVVRGDDGARVPLTMSAGVVCVGDDETLERALRRADEALYEAKSSGRNRTVTRD